MTAFARALAALFLCLIVAACAAAPDLGDGRAADSSPFTAMADGIDQLADNPIFQLAEKDAAATLAWVEDGANAPTDALTKAQAQVCPRMVQLAIADFKDKAKAWSERLRALHARVNTGPPDGAGVILAMTKLRYSTSPAANPRAELAAIRRDVYNRISAVVNGCRNILPTRQVVAVIRIAAKAGIAVSLPTTAPLLLAPVGLGAAP